VLSGGCSWFAVTDGSAFGDSIIRKAFRRTDPPQEIGVAASNSRTPRTKARRLVCNGGYSRFAVNDGLRFANPSYELIRLTAFVNAAIDWRWSSFHRWVRHGVYPPDWAGSGVAGATMRDVE
jgi:putative transposase